MRAIARNVAGAMLLLAAMAGSLFAQSWRYEGGIAFGGAWRTPSISHTRLSTGTGEGMAFGPGWLVGAQAGVRLLPLVTLRANGVFSPDNFRLGSTELHHGLNLWSASADLLLAERHPAREFTATEYLPYIALGAGVRFIRPTGVTPGARDGDATLPGAIVSTSRESFLLQRGRPFMGLAAVGTDVRVQRSLALRLELGDRIFRPPMARVEPVAGGGYVVVGKDVAAITHELYATVGMQWLMGVARGPVLAKASPATPRPASPRPPTPVAVPVQPASPPDRPVSLCVVDPRLADGMRMVDGLFRFPTADTAVRVNGRWIRTGDAYLDQVILFDQDWYIRDQPLTLGTGGRSIRFIVSGDTRSVRPGDVVYLGRVQRLPIFADPDDAAALARELATLPPGTRGDLDHAASDRPAIVAALRALKTIYVPVKRGGCILQTMRQQ